MNRLRGVVGLAIVATLLLSSCASTRGIEPAARMQGVNALGTADVSVDWPHDTWWTRLQDPTLDALIQRALADSPNLVTAQARLTRAQAAANAAASAQWPQVSAEADAVRQRYSENGLFPPPIAGATVTTYNLQLGGSWELDFFGRERNAVAAAVSAQRAATAEQQATRILLASNVARTYVQLGRLVELRESGIAIRTQREQILELVQGRVRGGLDTNVELRQAEGSVPAASQVIEALEEQIDLTRHALAALVGAGPDVTAQLSPRLPVTTEAAWLRLPAAIPADLIGRRADIAAARWRVEAAARDIDVARAEFYPNVNLAAFIGLQSLTLSNWASGGSTVWGVGPAIRLPIFDAGRLRANLLGRTAEYDAAVASYNTALIEAVHDVADQLSSLQSIERQAREQEKAQAAAESALDLAKLRYQAGLGTFVTVLTAEEAVVTQLRAATDLRARAVDVRIQLVRALGGGFVETDAPPVAATRQPPSKPAESSDS